MYCWNRKKHQVDMKNGAEVSKNKSSNVLILTAFIYLLRGSLSSLNIMATLSSAPFFQPVS